MGTKIPILLTVSMALTTDSPGFIEIDLATAEGSQTVAVLRIMARQTPSKILPMAESHLMHGGEGA
jgi:hypothetical protein